MKQMINLVDYSNLNKAIQIIVDAEKISNFSARNLLIKYMANQDYIISNPCENCLVIFRRATDVMVEAHIIISRPVRGVGEALSDLTEELFDTSDFNTIIAYLPTNLKSLERLIKRIGFKECGYLKDSATNQGKIQDLKIFRLYSEEN